MDTNQPPIGLAISNIVTSTEMLTNFMHQAESGKGLAGALLSNEELANNISILASNLAVASGNLEPMDCGLFFGNPKHPRPTRQDDHGLPRPNSKNNNMSLWYIRILFLSLCTQGVTPSARCARNSSRNTALRHLGASSASASAAVDRH